MTAETPLRASWQASDVSVNDIHRQITRLWQELSDETATRGTVRTHILNLVVYAPNEQAANKALQEMRDMPSLRPSRTVVLVADRLRPGTRVDAEVSISFEKRAGRPMGQEQLIVRAYGRVADHLGNLVIPLLVPELPTYLWWPGQPLFGHRIFHRLLDVADQLVIDSSQFQSPGDGFANITRLCSSPQGVNDFNWARLTPWRDIVCQFFDASDLLPYASQITRINVKFGIGGESPSRTTAGLLLLLGWLAHQLDWEPESTLEGLVTRDVELTMMQGQRLIPVDVRFSDFGQQAAGRLMGFDIEAKPEKLPGLELGIARTSDLEHAEVRIKQDGGVDMCRTMPLIIKRDPELLTDELELAGHDSLYERVAEVASRIAGREVWVTT